MVGRARRTVLVGRLDDVRFCGILDDVGASDPNPHQTDGFTNAGADARRRRHSGTTSTQSFTTSTGGPVTVNFGTITGGIDRIGADTGVVERYLGHRDLERRRAAGNPDGVERECSGQSVGGTVVPLAYVSIAVNRSVSFTQTPAIALTTSNTSPTYAYVAAYARARPGPP